MKRALSLLLAGTLSLSLLALPRSSSPQSPFP